MLTWLSYFMLVVPYSGQVSSILATGWLKFYKRIILWWKLKNACCVCVCVDYYLTLHWSSSEKLFGKSSCNGYIILCVRVQMNRQVCICVSLLILVMTSQDNYKQNALIKAASYISGLPWNHNLIWRNAALVVNKWRLTSRWISGHRKSSSKNSHLTAHAWKSGH